MNKDAAYRGMGTVLVAVTSVLVFLLGTNTALAKTYVCDVKHQLNLKEGILKAPGKGDFSWLKNFKKLVFDEESGVIKYGAEGLWFHPKKMKLWQKGSKENSMLAFRAIKGGVRNPLETLRISVWKKDAPFFWDNDGDYFTGTCKVYGR